MANKYLKTLTIDGVADDIFYAESSSAASGESSAAVTSYSLPAVTLSKGTYIVYAKCYGLAGSGTSNNVRMGLIMNEDGATGPYARFHVGPLNSRADITMTAIVGVASSRTISFDVQSSVARTLGASFRYVKISPEYIVV